MALPQRYVDRGVGHLVQGAAATAVPLLSGRQRRWLARLASEVPVTTVERVEGSPGREVTQSFALAKRVPARLHAVATVINRAINIALTAYRSPPVPPFAFNEWRLQYYPQAGCGISPHRDHKVYRHMVAILVLAGQGRFMTCDDRAGRGAVAVGAPAGWLILMRGAGFAGSESRPFHAVMDVDRSRWMLGMRCRRPD